ncbi:MAG: hypothetical protein FJ386_08370 [Verrucomicrobia bacterium]|nr:hypothetical protein [Verrucomicrobiota bacterium]
MKIQTLRLAACAALLLTGAGCASVFPSGGHTDKSPWRSFDDAKAAFDGIGLGADSACELKTSGFDPFSNPNVKILNHLELMQRFMPNHSIRLEDLPVPVRQCIAAQDRAMGYEMDITVTRNRRHGNLVMDMFRFNRKTHETGWQFKALVLVNDGTVVYKLWSGQPNIDRYDQKKRPLGPLQEIEASVGLPGIR